MGTRRRRRPRSRTLPRRYRQACEALEVDGGVGVQVVILTADLVTLDVTG